MAGPLSNLAGGERAEDYPNVRSDPSSEGRGLLSQTGKAQRGEIFPIKAKECSHGMTTRMKTVLKQEEAANEEEEGRGRKSGGGMRGRGEPVPRRGRTRTQPRLFPPLGGVWETAGYSEGLNPI